jgi:hypothetical protein
MATKTLSYMDRLRAAWKALAAKQNVHPTEGEILERVKSIVSGHITRAIIEQDKAKELGHARDADFWNGRWSASFEISLALRDVYVSKDASPRSHEDDCHAVG